jgi:hypothetical protein
MSRQGGKVDRRQQPSEAELLDDAIEVLTRRLPSKWAVEKATIGGDSEPRDLLLKSPNLSGQALILVEARRDVSPRDVQVLLGGPWRRWRRQAGNYPILLIAPYIGPRVHELLIEEGISYVDLTGNIRIELDQPGVFIEMKGSQRDPAAAKPRRGLSGAKVGSVVRVLVDAAPPYTGAEIARVAQVNEGYASRILETLDDEGLITRGSFGPVTAVDWPALLRRRAQALDLFRSSGTYRYVARQGTRSVLQKLIERPSEPPPTVTGSFAAARLAPVAAPTLLVVYTLSPRELAEDLKLLPAETGADTILVRPDNNVVFARSANDDGVWWAAPSQVAIDCLAGSGRMPAEGEAVIGWMSKDEGGWRYPSLRALIEATASRGGGPRG